MISTTNRLMTLVIGLVLIVNACSAASEAGEGSAEAIAVVEVNEATYIEAFLAQDLDAYMDTFTDDAVFVDEPFGHYLDGRSAVRAIYASVIRLADPDPSEIVDLFVPDDGAFAASTWEWIGTNFHGKPFDLPLALIHEYRDGKIERQTIYYASPDAYSQLLGS